MKCSVFKKVDCHIKYINMSSYSFMEYHKKSDFGFKLCCCICIESIVDRIISINCDLLIL